MFLPGCSASFTLAGPSVVYKHGNYLYVPVVGYFQSYRKVIVTRCSDYSFEGMIEDKQGQIQSLQSVRTDLGAPEISSN